MKIDRLLGITIYLLNRNKVTSEQLASKFEVSVRTIKRDIESLIRSGIPITSMTGVGGGYAILDTFGLSRPLASSADIAMIVSALKSLNTAFDDPSLNQTLEKMQAVKHDEHLSDKVFVDFSVVKEDKNLLEKTDFLKKAIKSKNLVKFVYHGHAEHPRKVEPLALNYRWYAWYLFAFDSVKNDYRIFKLNRISDLETRPEHFVREIENLADLLEKHWTDDQREIFRIKLTCQGKTRPDIEEIFHPKITETRANGDFICTFEVPEHERFWFSQLLGFGGTVQVLEPIELRERIQRVAREILENYKK
jgi:predicted DNA-binding transcriptional regulator YafY